MPKRKRLFAAQLWRRRERRGKSRLLEAGNASERKSIERHREFIFLSLPFLLEVAFQVLIPSKLNPVFFFLLTFAIHASFLSRHFSIFQFLLFSFFLLTQVRTSLYLSLL
jgi:hypothetical protein